MIKPVKLLITFILLLIVTSLVTTSIAIAQELEDPAVLWFYSQEPPASLPDPIVWDPYYVSIHPDAWLSESVVIPPDGGWETPFSIWLACHQFESLGTKLAVSINDAAAGAIDTISINIGGSITILDPDVLSQWDTSGDPPGALAPHGVFNSAEFYGYANVTVGDLYSPPDTPYKKEIIVEIELDNGAPSDMKIHFDAYGTTSDGKPTTNPYSHDLTFVVPEPGTIAAVATSLVALIAYTARRRKH